MSGPQGVSPSCRFAAPGVRYEIPLIRRQTAHCGKRNLKYLVRRLIRRSVNILTFD